MLLSDLTQSLPDVQRVLGMERQTIKLDNGSLPQEQYGHLHLVHQEVLLDSVREPVLEVGVFEHWVHFLALVDPDHGVVVDVPVEVRAAHALVTAFVLSVVHNNICRIHFTHCFIRPVACSLILLQTLALLEYLVVVVRSGHRYCVLTGSDRVSLGRTWRRAWVLVRNRTVGTDWLLVTGVGHWRDVVVVMEIHFNHLFNECSV